MASNVIELQYIRRILSKVADLVDALPRCSKDGCKLPGAWLGRGPKYYCDKHKIKSAIKCRWGIALEELHNELQSQD
jgi:hypothetical protein